MTRQWRHDIQHNGIQNNDIQHNDIQHNDIQHNDTQHNDIQHNELIFDTQHKRHPSNDTWHEYKVLVCFVVMLNVAFSICYAECHYAECSGTRQSTRKNIKTHR